MNKDSARAHTKVLHKFPGDLPIERTKREVDICRNEVYDGKHLREKNKLRFEDRVAHDWYRFILSFPPHLVRGCIERFGLNQGDTVLDPFCGTGTTLVECKKVGIKSIGIDTNPMACFASQIKVDWDVNANDMWNCATQIAKIVSERLNADGIEEESLPLFSAGRKARGNLRTLNPDARKLLLKNSISPVPLHKTLILLETLADYKRERFYGHLRLALAKAIVFGISNLHFGPEVGVTTPKNDAPVLKIWLKNVQTMAEDLQYLRKQGNGQAAVHRADSRQIINILDSGSIDAVITSPPYPNEKDYTRTTRLESVLLAFISTKEDLRSIKQDLIRSNTRGVYKCDIDDKLVADNEEIQKIANAIEKRRIALGKTSGFERLYAKVTRLYFGGMARHLSNLRPVLRPGARLAYVVGDQASYLRVLIRTGSLLAEIAKSLGYEVIDIDLFRTRGATATKEQLREEIVFLRWPGCQN